MSKRRSIIGCTALLITAVSCGGDGGNGSEANVGSVQLAVTGGESHDVTQFEFKIVEDGGDCVTGNVLSSAVVSLETESLPSNLGGGDAHAFADSIFVLPPGPYVACAAPLQSDLSPSAECAPASANVTVVPQQTTEIVLISQCQGDDTGAVDVIAALNDPPVIEDIDILPSKFIEVCEQADIALTAADINGDAISYSWAVTSQVAGSSPNVADAGANATFTTDMVGDYEVTVVATDVHLASTQLTFPIHVSPCSVWSLAATGNGTNQDTRVAVDGAGNVAVSIMFSGPTVDIVTTPVNNSGGALEAALAKLDPEGNVLWAKAIGSAAGDEQIVDLKFDANGDIFITGVSYGNIDLGAGPHTNQGNADGFVAKLSGVDGSLIWNAFPAGPAADGANYLAVDPNGDVFVAGFYEGTGFDAGGGTLTSFGGRDAWLGKYDGNNGSHLWSQGYGSAGSDSSRGVAAASNGDVVYTGSMSGAFAFAGGPTLTHQGITDIFVARLTGTTAAHVWSTSPDANSTRIEGFGGVALDANDDVFLSGYLEGTASFPGGPSLAASGRDMWAAKLDGTNGAHLWSTNDGSSGDCLAQTMALDTDGNVLIGGRIEAVTDLGGGPLAYVGDSDVFLLRLDNGTGAHLTSQSAGSNGNGTDQASSVAASPDGRVVWGGIYGNSGFDLGQGPLPHVASYEAFFHKDVF